MSKEVNEERAPRTVEDVKEMLTKHSNGEIQRTIQNCITILQNDHVLADAIRLNLLSERIDIVKPVGWPRSGKTLNDTDMKYILRRMEKYGISSEKKIESAIRIVANENRYHPIRDYLNGLQWDGTERIAHVLHHFLGAAEDEYTCEAMKIFLLGAIKRVFQPGCKFETMLCLVGGQGCGKSTFCFNLLPPDLNKYYTDSIDFSKKRDAELYLTRFGLINIDEFDQVSARHQGFLKHLLQKPVVNVRKPHATQVESVKRYASFIATSNHTDLLGDPSGSRRFICIEVTAPIQTNVTINYKQLYAQAMEAIYKGERYWLNDEDENILKQTNREFEQASPLEQLFHCYLNPVEEEMEGEWLTAMQILSYLQTKTRDKLAISKVGQFGRALQKLNIPCRKSRKGTLYHLVKVE